MSIDRNSFAYRQGYKAGARQDFNLQAKARGFDTPMFPNGKANFLAGVDAAVKARQARYMRVSS